MLFRSGAGDIVTFEQCGDDGGSCGGRADTQLLYGCLLYTSIRDAVHGRMECAGLLVKGNERVFPPGEGIDFLGYVTFGADHVRTVSYTHLDVYKRQVVLRRATPRFMVQCMPMRVKSAVLRLIPDGCTGDVYKRQVFHCRG